MNKRKIQKIYYFYSSIFGLGIYHSLKDEPHIKQMLADVELPASKYDVHLVKYSVVNQGRWYLDSNAYLTAFVELYIRTQVEQGSIVAFSNLYDISDSREKSLRIIKDLYQRLDIDDIYIIEETAIPFSESAEILFNKYHIDINATRRMKLNDIMPNLKEFLYDMSFSEELNHLGHDNKELMKHMSKCQYVSYKNIADYVKLPERTIRKIGGQGMKYERKGSLDLSEEQKKLLTEMVLKDYELARSRMEVMEVQEIINK